MKTNKILSTMAAGLLLFAGACTDEVSYDPAPKYDGNEVYFKLEEIGELDIDVDATSVSFNLYRLDTSKELTIGLTSTVVNPEGENVDQIFGVPTEVTFAAGANKTEVPVSIVFADVTPEMPYTMVVSINGETQTPYGATTGEFTLLYGTKYPAWEEVDPLGDGVFVIQGLWEGWYSDKVYCRQSINMPHLTQYKIAGPFPDPAWDYIMTVDHTRKISAGEFKALPDLEGECYFLTCNSIDTKTQDFWWLDIYTFWENYYLANGRELPWENFVGNCNLNDDMPPSYINETTGTIYVNFIAQKPDIFNTLSSYNAGGVQVLQLPGYKTYGVAIDEAGYNVLPGGLEEKKFQLFKTEDTPAMKYGMYQGTLTEEEVAAKAEEILASDQEEITASEATVAFELEAGEHTLVLIGIETEGEAPEIVATKAFSFTYAPSSADGFVTTGKCYYTDAFLCSLDGDIFPAATVTVDVQTNPEQPGIYRLKNPYRAWAEATENTDYLMQGNYYITVNAKDANLVYIEEFNTGIRVDPFQGPVIGYSKAAQELAKGTTPGVIKLRKLCGTMKKNVISFPTKTLLVNYQSELPEWAEANTRTNFKIDFNVAEDNAQEAPIRGKVISTGSAQSTIHSVNFDNTVVEAIH